MRYIKLFENFNQLDLYDIFDNEKASEIEKNLRKFNFDYQKLLNLNADQYIIDPDDNDDLHRLFLRGNDEVMMEINKHEDNGIIHSLNRVVFLNDISELNKDNLGIYWTFYEINDYLIGNLLDTMEYDEDPDGKKVFAITASFKISDINIEETILNRSVYPDETEITIRENAKPVKFEVKEWVDENGNRW